MTPLYFTQEQFEIALKKLNLNMLGAIDFKQVKYFEELEEDEKLKFYRYCSFIFQNPFWNTILKELMGEQQIFTTMESLGILQVIMGRGSCTGILQMNSFFEKYHKMFQSLSSHTKEITEEDKHKPL